MVNEYHPPVYRWEDMSDSFQSDLIDLEEHINTDALIRALEKSEKNSIVKDLADGNQRRKYAENADTYDARLIGILNEWATSDDPIYTRDGIMVDDKTATEYMYDTGISFTDVVDEIQRAFDNPNKSLFDKIQISIGGPALMSAENDLDSVKQFGQKLRPDLKEQIRSPLSEPENIEQRREINRSYIEFESENYQEKQNITKEIEAIESLTEREGMALQFARASSLDPIAKDQTVSFVTIDDVGNIVRKTTSEDLYAKHLESINQLKNASKEISSKGLQDIATETKQTKERMDNVKSVREKVSLSDLEDHAPRTHMRREKSESKESTKDMDIGKSK